MTIFHAKVTLGYTHSRYSFFPEFFNSLVGGYLKK